LLPVTTRAWCKKLRDLVREANELVAIFVSSVRTAKGLPLQSDLKPLIFLHSFFMASISTYNSLVSVTST
jgi:hypothetical protein